MIIRTRRRNWVGHVMSGDSLQREIIEGRMEVKRGRGKPRQKLLDPMMSEGYSKLKEEVQHRETWSRWRSGPARGQRTYEDWLRCRFLCSFVDQSAGLRLAWLSPALFMEYQVASMFTVVNRPSDENNYHHFLRGIILYDSWGKGLHEGDSSTRSDWSSRIRYFER